jgi:hypothetical protein
MNAQLELVRRRRGYALQMAEHERSLEQRLEEIGTQLAWVRDYL